MTRPLSWIELDTDAIKNNLKNLRTLITGQSKLMAVVKGQAYGHGMLPVARAAVEAGADWLGVFHIAEAVELSAQGLRVPILILGYVPFDDLEIAVQNGYHFTVSSIPSLHRAAEIASMSGTQAKLHLKLECGTHRLGFSTIELDEVLNILRAEKHLSLEGAHTHFANIEDTTLHDYARGQLEQFNHMLAKIRSSGFPVAYPHTACTAAAILFPDTHFAMVRIGIGMYGMWPSKETFLSAHMEGRGAPHLTPAMTWKTIVAQLKDVPTGSYVGYGCTYRTTRPTKIAVLPVGYANGYDRRLSNRSHVLIKGNRASVRGRVCMNLIMVDVTDIPTIEPQEEVVLLGKQGDEIITAEQMAAWADTINYEIVTRIDPHAPRLVGLPAQAPDA